MPIIRPSFSTISAGLYTDMATGLGNQPIAQFSILGSLGRALSRALDSLYGYADNRFANAVPWSATGSDADAWAALWGITRRAASSASGSATMTFNGAATIPAGSAFVGANGTTYTSTADVTASGAGTLPVTLTTTELGSAANLDPGATVTLSTGIPNVVAAGSVISMTGGADAESDALLFVRAQEARSNPPSGGGQGDYIRWALESGATRAWVNLTPNQPGTVVVYAANDSHVNGLLVGTNGVATNESRGTPATGEQLTIANYIFQPDRRPVTAFVQVVTPTANPINVTLTGCSSTSAATVAAVTAALQARLLAIGTPLGMTVEQSDITQAVQPVLSRFNISAPSATVTVPLGSLPTVGTVSLT